MDRSFLILGATSASIVAASGLGAVTGGLVGALISINIPETAARHYEQAVRRGNVLITVKTDVHPEKIQNLLTSVGPTGTYNRNAHDDRRLHGFVDKPDTG